MNGLFTQLQQMVEGSAPAGPPGSSELGLQLRALLQRLNTSETGSQLDAQVDEREQNQQGQQDNLGSQLSMLSDILGGSAAAGRAAWSPASAGPAQSHSLQPQHPRHAKPAPAVSPSQDTRQRQAAAIAAANNNQQQVHALLQHQAHLLQQMQGNLPAAASEQQQVPADAHLHAPVQQQQQQEQQHMQGRPYPPLVDAAAAAAAPAGPSADHNTPAGVTQQQQQLPQQLRPSVAHIQAQAPLEHQQYQPLQMHRAAAEQQQQLAQQIQLEQLQQQQEQQQQQQPEQPQKRRRGRPASTSTRMHPNLVYVRRFRERQKQMENDLATTVATRRQQVQQLLEEQQQLCVKWEALEQVLQVQSQVLGLMQHLTVSCDTAASDALVQEEDLVLLKQAPQQQHQQQQGSNLQDQQQQQPDDADVAMQDQREQQQLHDKQQQQQQEGDKATTACRMSPAQSKHAAAAAAAAASRMSVDNLAAAAAAAAQSPAVSQAATHAASPATATATLRGNNSSCRQQCSATGRPAASAAASDPPAAAAATASPDRSPPYPAAAAAADGEGIAVAAAAATEVLRGATFQELLRPSSSQQELLQQARQWLEPVKLYTMRAAIMLDQLGLLPTNVAAQAALAAAHDCPAALEPGSPLSAAAAADLVAAAVSTDSARSGAGSAAAAAAAAAVAVAARGAWDGCGAGDVRQDMVADGVPLVRYPYSIGMYVITHDAVKSVVWPLNMCTWEVDAYNNQEHAEQAGRALWAVLSPQRWRLLRATWLTMGTQLNQVQQDFARLHHLLQNMGHKSSSSSSVLPGSPSSSCAQSAFGAAAAAAAGGVGSGQQQKAHGVCFNGFASMEDSNAYDYAVAAVQVENVLLREDAISYQLCGAFLDLLDPVELAVGYVSSWPYHPQALAMFDVIFKLGEPPETLEELPTAASQAMDA